MIKIHVAASRQYDVILNKGILSMTGMYVKDALGVAKVFRSAGAGLARQII